MDRRPIDWVERVLLALTAILLALAVADESVLELDFNIKKREPGLIP